MAVHHRDAAAKGPDQIQTGMVQLKLGQARTRSY